MEISEEQALDCFASDDLIGIGMEADAVRRALHPENVVTYVVGRPVSLSQSPEKVDRDLEDAVHAGDTTACLVSGADLPLTFAHLEETLTRVRKRFPSLHLQALSTSGILAVAQQSGLIVGEALTRLRAAGLDAFSGDDLCACNSDSATLLQLEPWFEVHRLAHQHGIRSTAGLVFGMGESFEQRVELLFTMRSLQAQSGGFVSFTPWSHKPPTPRSAFEEATAVEYLRTLAISRMVLDNVANIESSCTALGLKVTQMALRFGANDAGSIPLEDGTGKRAFTEEDLRRVIRDAGLRPVERDAVYRTVFLNN